MNGLAVVEAYREYWNYYACYIDMVASYMTCNMRWLCEHLVGLH